MARILQNDESSGRAALAAAGVTVHVAAVTEGALDAAPALVDQVLPAGMREIKGELVAQPVGDDVASSGMGAWHVNSVDELHAVTSGQGIMEFLTPEGPVAVLVEAGDVLEIRQAEHRYRPLTEQGWILRFAAVPGGDLGATDTGRESGGWPSPE